MKHEKQDPKLVAGKQKHEVDYFKREYGVSARLVRQAIAAVGHSRERIMEHLKETGAITEPKSE